MGNSPAMPIGWTSAWGAADFRLGPLQPSQWRQRPHRAMGPNPDPSPAAIDPASADHPHDFEVQKAVHQQIRNDPDYDDWEYGTEPLPHEAWTPSKPEAQA